MRQGQQNRRGRGRTNGGSSSNSSNHNGGSNSSNNNNNHNNGRKPQNPLSRNYESSGPDVKIRGTAAQIAEKYTALARDASAASDVIMVENYLQHAEHYNRIIMAAQAQQPQVPLPVQQQPSVPSHHVQENGHERGHGNNLPQRISPDANGAFRDQPQPVITFEEAPAAVQEVAVEQPEPVAPPPAPKPAPREKVAKDDATREEAPRRRRRRYPAGGTGDRAATGPADANGAEVAKDVAKSDRPADEAIA